MRLLLSKDHVYNVKAIEAHFNGSQHAFFLLTCLMMHPSKAPPLFTHKLHVIFLFWFVLELTVCLFISLNYKLLFSTLVNVN